MDAYLPIQVEQSPDEVVFTASYCADPTIQARGESEYEAVENLYPLLRSKVQRTKNEEYFFEPEEEGNKDQKYLRINMFSEGERLLLVMGIGSILAVFYCVVLAYFLCDYYFDPSFHPEISIDLVFDSIYPAFSRLVPWFMVLFILMWSMFYSFIFLPLIEGYARVLFRVPLVSSIHRAIVYLPGSVVDAINVFDKPPFLVVNHYVVQRVNECYHLLPRVKSMRIQGKSWSELLRCLQRKVFSQFQIIVNPIGKTINMSPYTLEFFIPVDRSQLNIRDGIYFYGIFFINSIIITNYYFFSGGVFGIDASASIYQLMHSIFPGIEQVFHAVNLYLWLMVNLILGTIVLYFLYLPAIYLFGWLPSKVLRILVSKIYTLE